MINRTRCSSSTPVDIGAVIDAEDLDGFVVLIEVEEYSVRSPPGIVNTSQVPF